MFLVDAEDLEYFCSGNYIKRTFPTKKRKYYLFYIEEKGLCYCCVRCSGRRIPGKVIKEELQKIEDTNDKIFLLNTTPMGYKEFLDSIKDDRKYYFYIYKNIIYAGDGKPLVLYDKGRIPLSFFKRNVWICSIYKKFLSRMAAGKKKYELRKEIPYQLSKGDVIFFHVMGEGIKGCVVVKEVYRDTIDNLWNILGRELGVNKSLFYNYFRERTIGYALEIDKIRMFKDAVSVREIIENTGKEISTQGFFPLSPLPSVIEYLINRLGLEDYLE